ncbi:MAG: ATP-binding cassette domain-containing protein [Verrucomicrobiota bacterium]
MRLLAIGVTQDSGAARALCGGVQLALAAGELHALLGPDGVGKSALLQILGGVRRPGRGLLLLDGQPYAPGSPGEARRAGVWIAGRGATLADGLTVEENLVLGAEPARRGWIDRDARRTLACQALAGLPGAAIPASALAGALSVADRRRVEIARALLAVPKVLLVEAPEPYSPAACAPFFGALRRLAAGGASILYATRSLEAARALCTRYTLLREEGTAASGRIRGDGLEALGEGPFPRLPRRMGRALLQRGDGLTLHEGEILGLAGMSGGAEPLRATGGILPGLSIADNLTLPSLRRFSQWGILSRERQDKTALDWMEKLHLWARTPRLDVAELSAADRQKILLGRLLLEQEAVLCLEAPTRGLAGPAKRQIHALLQSIAAEGRGILIASADPAELLALCDTIALPRPGRPLECRPAARWTERELAAALLERPPRRGERSRP